MTFSMFLSLKLIISVISHLCLPKLVICLMFIEKNIISDVYRPKVDDVSMFIPKVDES